MRSVILALLATVALAAGCGDDGPTTQEGSGTLEISTATTGGSAAEYSIVVDGASPRAIASTGTLSIDQVVPGTHIVQLTVPAGCIIGEQNPRTVNVSANAVTTVAFTVTCG
jgi:hypothetical protein